MSHARLISRTNAVRLSLGAGLSLLALTLPSSADAAVGYIRSTVGSPWGTTANEEAMDLVFGMGNWDDLRYETVDPLILFSDQYAFLYIEGSDDNAQELATFLMANQVALEAWVNAGGRLFLNAGPNEGGNINFGFGGVTLVYPGTSTNPGTAFNSGHPIWNGPHLPMTTSFTGSSYAHARITGPGLTPLLRDANLNVNLSERATIGSGQAVFGGLTTSNFWSPQPEALNLRANIIEYLMGPDTDGDGSFDIDDNCPADPNPMQVDTDMDGAGDVCDVCPDDPMDDSDGDMACDSTDNCPNTSNPTQTDGDMDGAGDACDDCPADPNDDVDGDTVCGDIDNCPDDSNVNQADDDGDGIGNVCDACEDDSDNDPDGDGVCEMSDNCPGLANDDQADADGDGAGDACDTCPDDPEDDADGDGVCGDVDNCPDDANADQADADGNGIGDACDAASDSTGSDPTGGDTDGATGGTGVTGLTGLDLPEPSGCACTTDERGGDRPWWLLALVGVFARRRRRRAA